MARKYKPGDQILPKVTTRERTAEERRAQQEDQRLMDEVREMSLREATGAPPLPPRTRRHRDGHTSHTRSRSSEDPASESRRRRDGSHRPRRDDGGRQSVDQLNPTSEYGRRRRSESRQRQVEHQSSLRSLISSGDMSERDIEREIEDFARQIQEEGLLDGLDLDNIDLSRNDELSRRITEAYRRRQRERPRQEPARRSNHSAHSSSSRVPDGNPPDSSRRRNGSYPGSRSTSATGNREDRSRPPPSMSAALDGRESGRGGRRRATSGGGRATTAPVVPMYDESRQAARSVTDLTRGPAVNDSTSQRPSVSEGRRSSSTPNVGASVPPPRAPAELPATGNNNLQSFAIRAQAGSSSSPVELAASSLSSNPGRSSRPADLAIVHTSVVSPKKSPTHAGHNQRHQLYPEPSITCSRCRKHHIEYELHYNCHICSNGQWNICLDCYRAGKGCMYWFGFGYGAWKKWEVKRQRDSSLAPPHMLTASRYAPPPTTPGGADGRKTLTTDDPRNRLESGTFCSRCHVWTNECYWRCDICNEGDWGFCNNCVNQGKSCTHLLLPLSHEATQSQNQGRPVTPRSPGRPPTATILTGPQASNIGPFKPLTFMTRCDVCQDSIRPEQPRYHCFDCVSALVPDASVGDYDICFECYNNLVNSDEISAENGNGWRRCLNGHRMAIVGFTDGQIGQWRYVDRDIVGGRVLRMEPFESAELNGVEAQKWSWKEGDRKMVRLVTKDVKATAPQRVSSNTFAQTFPPDGGTGRQGIAGWAWYPKPDAEDELLFPRGAEIREIEDVNGDWFFGSYMGAKGLFPAPYVRIQESHDG